MTGTLGVALTLALVVAASPATLDDRFKTASEHYWAGRYGQAYEGWRALADYGIGDADLFYDLGSAAFQLGRPGEALGWFERARRLDPHDGDLLANMEATEEALAGGKVVRVVEKGTAAGEGSFEWWYRLFTSATGTELAWFFGALHLLFFGLLIARRYMDRGPRRSLAGWAAVVALVGVVASEGLLVGHAYVHHRVGVGVVTGRPTAVRDGPTPEARVLFELPEGQLVRVLAAQDGYRHALVNPSLQGWVEDRQVMVVR